MLSTGERTKTIPTILRIGDGCRVENILQHLVFTFQSVFLFMCNVRPACRAIFSTQRVAERSEAAADTY